MDHSFLFTSLEDAHAEIIRRSKNESLKSAVSSYLDNDIPWHFTEFSPLCYLCRHLITPNYETLRFIELAHSVNLPCVVGQDHDDIFVSNNRLKRALGKLPVSKGVNRLGDEIVENFTIVDFDAAQGKPLRTISTTAGVSLIDFHTGLLKQIYPDRLILADEADWISRNGRGNLLGHYKKLLSLFIAHGIMFEWYESDEVKFVEEILVPAFTEVTEHFGIKPLIVQLVPKHLSHVRDWNTYPSVVYRFVQEASHQHLNQSSRVS